MRHPTGATRTPRRRSSSTVGERDTFSYRSPGAIKRLSPNEAIRSVDQHLRRSRRDNAGSARDRSPDDERRTASRRAYPPPQVGTLALVPQVVAAVKVPVIAAGGIADAKGVRAAMALGAAGVQVGTAYLLCPEATTSAVHRAALKGEAARRTALTNLFSGRPARGIVNRLMRELGPMSPAAPPFPLAAPAVAPLRAGPRVGAAGTSRRSGRGRTRAGAGRCRPRRSRVGWRPASEARLRARYGSGGVRKDSRPLVTNTRYSVLVEEEDRDP